MFLRSAVNFRAGQAFGRFFPRASATALAQTAASLIATQHSRPTRTAEPLGPSLSPTVPSGVTRDIQPYPHTPSAAAFYFYRRPSKKAAENLRSSEALTRLLSHPIQPVIDLQTGYTSTEALRTFRHAPAIDCHSMGDFLDIIFSGCLEMLATFMPDWTLSSGFAAVFALLALISLTFGILAANPPHQSSMFIASASCAVAAFVTMFIGRSR
ncbi:MAG: hypothetical protein ACTHLZ_12365 [Tepidisphaeraceae bacterium]